VWDWPEAVARRTKVGYPAHLSVISAWRYVE
jgi:hypothetical protein